MYLDERSARGRAFPRPAKLEVRSVGLGFLGAILRTKACDLLGCHYPVVLAGMGGVARSELVVAVTQAGGFGFLGMVREPLSLIRREVEEVRRMNDETIRRQFHPRCDRKGITSTNSSTQASNLMFPLSLYSGICWKTWSSVFAKPAS